jgi:hypothetical protein
MFLTFDFIQHYNMWEMQKKIKKKDFDKFPQIDKNLRSLLLSFHRKQNSNIFNIIPTFELYFSGSKNKSQLISYPPEDQDQLDQLDQQGADEQQEKIRNLLETKLEPKKENDENDPSNVIIDGADDKTVLVQVDDPDFVYGNEDIAMEDDPEDADYGKGGLRRGIFTRV